LRPKELCSSSRSDFAAIDDYIANHNDDPKPFVWTKTADEIIAKVKRGRVALEQARAN
jgi:hypothetical protein